MLEAGEGNSREGSFLQVCPEGSVCSRRGDGSWFCEKESPGLRHKLECKRRAFTDLGEEDMSCSTVSLQPNEDQRTCSSVKSAVCHFSCKNPSVVLRPFVYVYADRAEVWLVFLSVLKFGVTFTLGP